MSKAMIYIDGVLREMAPEDERYFPEIEMPPPEPTPEERLQALETQNEALIDKLRAALILLGLED